MQGAKTNRTERKKRQIQKKKKKKISTPLSIIDGTRGRKSLCVVQVFHILSTFTEHYPTTAVFVSFSSQNETFNKTTF